MTSTLPLPYLYLTSSLPLPYLYLTSTYLYLYLYLTSTLPPPYLYLTSTYLQSAWIVLTTSTAFACYIIVDIATDDMELIDILWLPAIIISTWLLLLFGYSKYNHSMSVFFSIRRIVLVLVNELCCRCHCPYPFASALEERTHSSSGIPINEISVQEVFGDSQISAEVRNPVCSI